VFHGSVSTSPEQEILLENQAFLRRLARGLVDEHRADDLVQDAALVVLRRPPPRAGPSMRAWLSRVARSLAANSARDERVRAEHELRAASAGPASPPHTPAEVAQQIEVQREVLAALARLEEPYKSTLFLRYWDDLGPNAIAARTGVPVATVKIVVEADGTHVVSQLAPASYVVVLVPRAVDSSRTCLFVRTELEVELAPGARVEREWLPEVGGGLRLNMIGPTGPWTTLRDGSGKQLKLGFRIGTSTSTGVQIPGVNELLGALPAGLYELHVQTEDGSERFFPVRVEAGRINDVEVDLGRP